MGGGHLVVSSCKDNKLVKSYQISIGFFKAGYGRRSNIFYNILKRLLAILIYLTKLYVNRV